ncbi:hydroxyethylthiazole kinase [Chryseobacterium arthrosphaerae]|uniref:hydroxyethylthiazole kinase n=1 Tax=Chryseobacterium arthrosphaerae TaxID=651561 RepID=UPI0023E2CC93|nr:hydroxyethylthiazole kinase [Chryseobacterium arthrosphaerae]WES97452.1 hydroxyethylthiazole kinase [Chryseobacterium arthrosphaerae]
MEKILWQQVQLVKQKSPLVHNITNYVVMNNTANALLAAGASPIMAHAKSEIREMVNISNAVVINIGTLDEYWSESMFIAAETANAIHKPWVLDPVGAGATSFRDQILQQLLEYRPTVIRGNASEIIALAKINTTVTKGVDSTAASNDALDAAQLLVNQLNTVVCISGETDIILSPDQCLMIRNGHPLMTKVTGLGCSATALTGAFAGCSEDKTSGVAAAMALLGIAGEIAVKESKGPGSLQVNLIDKLYNITEEEFISHLKIDRK